MHCWVDGQPATAVSLQNRGLAYGDGLFETLAVRSGRASLLEAHMARLALGCQRLGIEIDLPLVQAEVQRFAALIGDGVAKLIVTRGEGQRGYASAPGAGARRILQSSPLPAYPRTHADAGVRLYRCQTRLAEQPLLAGLKHLNRLEQVLARGEWQDTEHAEGVMCDARGRVIEGVYSNLFMVQSDQLITADLSRCGVAGVMRGALLDHAFGAGITTQVRDVAWADLAAADEVFVCNSVYGIWPVIACHTLNWSPGPLTRKLQAVVRTILEA